MPARTLVLLSAGLSLAFRLSAQPLDLQGYRLVDLTHSYNAGHRVLAFATRAF
jgi:hypothetical protein